MLIYAQAWHQTQKAVVATPCQFDSDLRHYLPIAGLELSMERWNVISGGAGFDD